MKIALDGYVLRFPRTGIVNYGFAAARGYRERLPSEDFRVLLGDRNVTAPEIRNFLASGDVIPILENPKETLAERLGRKVRPNLFRNFMPGLRSAVSEATRGFDVYHCTDWFFEPSRHVKLNVITCYDFTTTLFPQFHEALNITKEQTKISKLREFDFVFCISEATRRDLLDISSVNPARAIVNYLDTDPIFNRREYLLRETLVAKYQMPSGRPYLLSVSTVEPRKNFRHLLDSFGRFLETHPDSPHILVCTGMWGWKNDDLKDHLAACGFADRVVFTGFIGLDDLPSLYHHADGFLYLSLYEGFGLPILEAMKSNCPVICSNTSSMPEVIGDAGILVSPTNIDETAAAIAAVTSHESKADAMRSAGLARSRMFSWGRHLDCLMSTYAA